MQLVDTLHNLAIQFPWLPWAGFTALILFLLMLDLGVFNKNPHAVSTQEALGWSAVWISLGLAFGGFIWWVDGAVKGTEYFTGFIIEKSLSVDNIFVFIMIFNFFHVKPKYQHKIIFYGILCALVFRGIAIWGGVVLLEKFTWLMYVFGAFLIVTGIKMYKSSEKEMDPNDNPVLMFITKRFKMVPNYDTAKFFQRVDGKLAFTPIFLALIAIEISDVVFAIDSVPAIFAVTKDPFIVYTSNVFAILGLRSLYFISSHLIQKLKYLTHGVAIVLVFVGIKMMIANHYHLPSSISLAFILVVLSAAVAFSLKAERDEKALKRKEKHHH